MTRTQALSRAINLSGAALLIALAACVTLAQEPSQPSEPAGNPYDWNIGGALSTTGTAISQSSQRRVELFRVASRLVSSKCDFLSLASPAALRGTLSGVRLLNYKTTDRVHNGELFSFASGTAKSGSAAASRTRGKFVPAQAGQAQAPQNSATDAQELVKKLSNPVASLISLPLQSNFDFGMGTGSGWRYTLNVQPVYPIALSPKWNLISRTILPIIHQGDVTGPNQSQSGLGDTVQSLFFSPNKAEPFVWAVGPVFLLPTATDAALGAQKWGVGPTALVLKQKKGWTIGALANHIWSVAGKSNRAEVNATFVQPFLAYSTKDAWTYSLNTESTYDWNSHSWSVPINFNISKLVRFGKQPVSFGAGPKCWVTTPTGGAEGCGLRIIVTALFPKK